MSWLRDWLIDTLNVDVVPPSWIKYVIVVAASFVGGLMYARSGSWLNAIQWDLTAMFVIWMVTKVAEPLGENIVKALLFIIP